MPDQKFEEVGKNKPPPPNWGADDLTSFLDHARDNQWATFANKREWIAKLIALDRQFVVAENEWINPDNEVTATLFVRCHASFRAATSLCMAGFGPETFVQCRSMLECAGYAVHIFREPSLSIIWLDRHQGADSQRVQRDVFQHWKVVKSIKAANVHAGKRFSELYDRTIDFGGHPNERAVTGNIKIIENDSAKSIQSIILHENGLELEHGLKTVAQCAMNSLEMLQIVFNARFEILGINSELLRLREGL